MRLALYIVTAVLWIGFLAFCAVVAYTVYIEYQLIH